MKNKKLLALGTILTTMAPIASVVACSSEAKPKTVKTWNIDNLGALPKTGVIYASKVADEDNLIALGYQPSYVDGMPSGNILPSYLNKFVQPRLTNKLSDSSWKQTVNPNNIWNKNIGTAFISNSQKVLYGSLLDAGIDKNNIGYATMGETYVPDMEYRTSHMPAGDNQARGILNATVTWNATNRSNSAWGKAFSTSTRGIHGNLPIHLFAEGEDTPTATFDYTADPRQSLRVTGENIDRITGGHKAIEAASKINGAFGSRILNLKRSTNLSTRSSALVLKANRNARKADEIIDPNFSWAPTVMPFLYSDSIGMGYNMPKYHPGNRRIEYTKGDVEGLSTDTQVDVEADFDKEVDQLFFLKPKNYAVSDRDITTEILSMQKNGREENVHIVDEDLWYQSGFGMLGYFQQMDAYAEMFNVDSSFKTGINNWDWTPTAIDNLRFNM